MPQMKTPWYPHTVKPVRIGWYEVGHTRPVGAMHHLRLTGVRRYWDGTHWKAGWLNDQISIFGQHETHQWRGFTTCQDPEQLPAVHSTLTTT